MTSAATFTLEIGREEYRSQCILITIIIIIIIVIIIIIIIIIFIIIILSLSQLLTLPKGLRF